MGIDGSFFSNHNYPKTSVDREAGPIIEASPEAMMNQSACHAMSCAHLSQKRQDRLPEVLVLAMEILVAIDQVLQLRFDLGWLHGQATKFSRM